jgi:hypothetical protein
MVGPKEGSPASPQRRRCGALEAALREIAEKERAVHALGLLGESWFVFSTRLQRIAGAALSPTEAPVTTEPARTAPAPATECECAGDPDLAALYRDGPTPEPFAPRQSPRYCERRQAVVGGIGTCGKPATKFDRNGTALCDSCHADIERQRKTLAEKGIR